MRKLYRLSSIEQVDIDVWSVYVWHHVIEVYNVEYFRFNELDEKEL